MPKAYKGGAMEKLYIVYNHNNSQNPPVRVEIFIFK